MQHQLYFLYRDQIHLLLTAHGQFVCGENDLLRNSYIIVWHTFTINIRHLPDEMAVIQLIIQVDIIEFI